MESILTKTFGTISNLIRSQAAKRPGHAALIQDGKTLTYGELDARMDQVAAAMQREGIKSRETIAICAGTSLDYVCVFLGSVRAGVVVAPLSPAWSAESV